MTIFLKIKEFSEVACPELSITASICLVQTAAFDFGRTPCVKLMTNHSVWPVGSKVNVKVKVLLKHGGKIGK